MPRRTHTDSTSQPAPRIKKSKYSTYLIERNQHSSKHWKAMKVPCGKSPGLIQPSAAYSHRVRTTKPSSYGKWVRRQTIGRISSLTRYVMLACLVPESCMTTASLELWTIASAFSAIPSSEMIAPLESNQFLWVLRGLSDSVKCG